MPPYIESGDVSSSLTASELRILYEDNHLIAVFKPSGVLTQGDRSGVASLMDVVKQWLRQKYQKPGEVFLGLLHRLDRPVSGIVLFAKTSKGASRISEQIREHRVEKIYWAAVQGVPHPGEAHLVHYLRDGVAGKVEVSPLPLAQTKKASLRYRVVRQTDQGSILEVSLETGRKHQIRAQLSFIGHPIYGDRRYGGAPREGGIRLVAKRFCFTHPVRHEERICVDLPADLLEMGLGQR